MSTFSDRMQNLITAFTKEVIGLVQDDVLSTIERSLGANHSDAHRFDISRGVRSVPAAAKVSSGKNGAKRTPAQIAAVTERVYQYVQQHPGCSVEQLKKALKLDISEVSLPVSKLLASKRITKRGVKRATRYTVAAEKVTAKGKK